MTILPAVVGALETVSKGLKRTLGELKIVGKIETNQTTSLLRSARILRTVQETGENFPSLRLQ